jgi:alkanesulfonate monooxygenase SsuD/methylene tetrahydromethanopterin reductase-like flavin-dependent oxidoreductase (luciferase family)
MSTLKFGLALPINHPKKTAELAHLAEDSGWDGLFLGDAIWCLDPMVALAAAAMSTSRIRLGTMVIPVPLRRPWKIASEAVALDILSDGRLTLGLGAGAVWMGWQAFPDEVTDTRARTEMLDETIDILTLLFHGKQFDYDGQHYHLKLTAMDEMHYPAKPVQQPRVPLWAVGVWPRMKSMKRVLKCDGLFPNKINPEGKFEDLTPADVREIKAYVESNRGLDTPFDIVVEGKTAGLNRAEMQDKLGPWVLAGATWWIESLWGGSEEQIAQRIQAGPPNAG